MDTAQTNDIKWMLPELMTLKVICYFIDISFCNINTDFHTIQRAVF